MRYSADIFGTNWGYIVHAQLKLLCSFGTNDTMVYQCSHIIYQQNLSFFGVYNLLKGCLCQWSFIGFYWLIISICIIYSNYVNFICFFMAGFCLNWTRQENVNYLKLFKDICWKCLFPVTFNFTLICIQNCILLFSMNFPFHILYFTMVEWNSGMMSNFRLTGVIIRWAQICGLSSITNHNNLNNNLM